MSSVSVVVPCYRYGRYLEESVGSVLDQEGVDVRVLVIDDASGDDSPDVAREIASRDPRVEVSVHAANRGHIGTYNEGLLDWASGDYTVLLSADDRLAPGALKRATELLDAHPNVGFAYGNVLWFHEGDRLPRARNRSRAARVLIDLTGSAVELRRAGAAARERFLRDYEAAAVAPRLVGFLEGEPSGLRR
jgi:glycosyltransferase involved in cell wall biosynthesis